MNRPSRSFRPLIPALILGAVTWTLTSATPAPAEHARRPMERIAGLAHELELAAQDAYHLTHEHGRGYTAHELRRNFEALERAANRFHEQAHHARSPFETERDFRRLADRYYETRRTFRGFHGSTRVRQAFHRINTPMESLYRVYTGRDLYRDDPYVRTHRHVTPRDRGRDRGRRLGHRDLDDRRIGRGEDRDFDRRDRDERRGRNRGRGGRRP